MDALDFGCGTGLLSLRLQPFVRTMTCVDSSQGMLDALEAKVQDHHLANVTIRRLDVEAGDELPGRYHLITSSMSSSPREERRASPGPVRQGYPSGGTLCLADLRLEGGRFHADNTGVFHQGFDRAALRRAILSGYEDIRERTATVVEKPNSAGTSNPSAFSSLRVSTR